MPRIADEILDCVVYLYPSVADAESGEAVGGTGFLVLVPSSHEGYGYVYCVTNSHVIREGASPVIRLNTSDGGKGIVRLTEDDWVHHHDGDDLAACALVLTEPNRYRFDFVPTAMFLTQELIQQHNIGPGDDVFMVGRFVSHEGRQRNTPLVRFGNISMMPHEPVMHPRGITQESFLVETRSLGGFSGSPVFVQIPSFASRPGATALSNLSFGPWLLGVDWAHVPVYEKVKEKNARDDVPEGWVVESNSGQMAVAPAWRLQDLLNQKELAMQRKQAEDELAKRKESSPVTLDMHQKGTKESDEDANTFTGDDFFRDLK